MARGLRIGHPAGFNLAIHSSGRYLTKNGSPFMMMGDASWELAINCTAAEIDRYLDDRAGKGCTAILTEAIEALYTYQTPKYRNVYGEDPFTNMSGPNWVLNNSYWNRIDYMVNACLSRGMVVIMNPAYMNSGDGWATELAAASNATLTAYGEALANRYTQGNVIWCAGGDYCGEGNYPGAYGASTPERTKQWRIFEGIRNVNPNVLITGHTARYAGDPASANGEAYAAWYDGFTGFNLNNTYTADDKLTGVQLATSAYGRPGPMPFFMLESGYEDIDGTNAGGTSSMVQTVLRGGLGGWIAGHDILWSMGGEAGSSNPTAVMDTYLSTSWDDSSSFAQLLSAKEWWKLVPKTDTSLVTVAPGNSGNVLCPALASDGTFALIWAPSTSSFTVNMDQFSISSVRGRWLNLETNSYTTASGSPYSNTGTQTFTPPAADRLLILDAVP